MTDISPETLAAEMRPLLTRLHLLYFRQSVQSDLSSAQLSIMSLLQGFGSLRVSDIARLEAIRMPTASNAVHQLEQEGMVTRERDPNDRRGVKVVLTERGRDELKSVGQERNEQFARMLSGLNDSRLKQAKEAISLIEDILKHYAEVYEQETDIKLKPNTVV